MSEEKTVGVKDTTENLAEEKQEKVTGGGGPKDGWRCNDCGKTFVCLPFNSRCPDCGGFVGVN